MDAPASAAQVPTTAPVIWIVATLMAGVLIGYLWARSRAMTKHRSATSGRAHERANWQAQVDREQGDVARLNGQLTSERAALAQARDDLKREQGTRNQLDQRMAPLQALVSKLSEQQADSERALQRSNTELREQITAMGTRLSHASNTFDAASKGVSTETRRLTQALSRSETRGTWGEMQLRRLVESAGMLNHVHFVEQDHIKTDLGTRRPDLVVDLAGGRRIVVDAKVPLDSYLRMGNGVSQEGTINSASHADAVANHIKELSKRAYWKHYDTPDFVVLFLPAESLLGTALEARPELLQSSFDANIILATPTTLLALLRTVAYSWQQLAVATQAKEIQQLGTKLHDRLQVMARHFTKLGASLSGSVNAYNQTVSSMESRVLPTARRFADLSGASTPLGESTSISEDPQNLDAQRWHVELAALSEPTPAIDSKLAAGHDSGSSTPQPRRTA